MSPLGTVLVSTSSVPSASRPLVPPSVSLSLGNLNDPLLRLMSLSLEQASSAPFLNHLHNLANTHCPSSVAMQYKPFPVTSQHPTMSPTTTTKENEEDKEGKNPSPSSTTTRASTNGKGSHGNDRQSTNSSSESAPSSPSAPNCAKGSKSTPHHVHRTLRDEQGNERALVSSKTNDDDDEVLSIGREDDDQMVIDCDSSTLSDQETDIVENVESDKVVESSPNHHQLECLDMDQHVISPGSPSPNPSDSSNSTRVRNYSSSEDCNNRLQHDNKKNPQQPQEQDVHLHSYKSSVHTKSSCSSKEKLFLRNESSNRSSMSSRESLMFSIANILRPDFGLSPQLQQLEQLQQQHHHHHHYLPAAHPAFLAQQQLRNLYSNYPYQLHASNNNHHNSNHNHSNPPKSHQNQSEQSAVTSTITPSFPKKYHNNNQSKGLPSSSSSSSPSSPKRSKMRRLDPIVPIDLSRPSSTDSSAISAISPIHSRKKLSSSSSRSQSKSNSKPTGNKTKDNLKVNSDSNNSSSSNNPKDLAEDGNNEEAPAKNPDWPAWVYCTRYSDRPSSGPRTRRGRKKEKEIDEKRPRTAFTADQLQRLKKEFEENRYLTEKRRQDLARDLRLHENQIKIWFQNKRAKLKKSTGQRGGLALQLMKQGLYNHSTIPKSGPEDDSD